jgi:hypothetical protein
MANPAPRGPWSRRPSPATRKPPPHYHDFASWDFLFRLTRKGVQHYGPVESRPVAQLPCELVLTNKPNHNGKVLIVRCRCMAGTISTSPSRRFFNYDPLGEATSLKEAGQLWREHHAARVAAERAV